MKNTRWSQVVGKDVDASTSQETIELAGLNWNVLQAPVYFNDGEKNVVIGNRRMNYREDTKVGLGIVSDGYKVLQNRESFRFLDSLVGVAEAMFVNAGSFRDGAKVYIQAKLPGYIKFDDGGIDVGEKLLTFVTSHDGSLPVSVMFTPVRIICQNTLLMALRQNVRKTSVRHTINMAMGMSEIKETLGILNNQFSLLEHLSQHMTKVNFDAKNFPQLLQKSDLIPKEIDPSTRAKNITEEVTNLFYHGAGSDLPSAKGTAWGAYNAVVEYVDHFRGKDAAKRAESLLLGNGANVKEKAFEFLSI